MTDQQRENSVNTVFAGSAGLACGSESPSLVGMSGAKECRDGLTDDEISNNPAWKLSPVVEVRL